MRENKIFNSSFRKQTYYLILHFFLPGCTYFYNTLSILLLLKEFFVIFPLLSIDFQLIPLVFFISSLHYLTLILFIAIRHHFFPLFFYHWLHLPLSQDCYLTEENTFCQCKILFLQISNTISKILSLINYSSFLK